jgi:hypothetical protein
MRLAVLSAALLLHALLLSSRAQADEQIPFFAGPADLAKMCPNGPASEAQLLACQNYVVGVVDAMSLVRANEPALSKHLGCIGGSTKPSELRRIVGKYIAENPKQLDKPAVFVVREALIKAFPCPDKPAAAQPKPSAKPRAAQKPK